MPIVHVTSDVRYLSIYPNITIKIILKISQYDAARLVYQYFFLKFRLLAM